MKRIKRLGLGVANRLVPLIPLRSRLERLINTRWYDFPFGRQPHASQEEYLRRAAEARQQRYPKSRPMSSRLDLLWMLIRMPNGFMSWPCILRL